MTLEFLLQIKIWIFVVALLLVLALEWLTPLQRRPPDSGARWFTNFSLYALASYLGHWVLPTGLMIFIADQPGAGLVTEHLAPLAAIVFTVFCLDLWRYWQHRWLHDIPLLWRAHLVHHSDTALDVTTAERHHPLESMFSLFMLLGLVLLLGLPAEGVLVYQLLALPLGLLSHANIDLPAWLDRPLRSVLVTPSVHAIHHSDRPTETDSNYGAVLSVWDRMFGSYVSPESTTKIRFGLEYFSRPADNSWWRALLQPFVYSR